MGVFVAIEVDGIVRWALVFHRLHRPCIGVILSEAAFARCERFGRM